MRNLGVESIQQLESYREAERPRKIQSNATFSCPECGGSAPVRARGEEGSYYRRCWDCEHTFWTIKRDGIEIVYIKPNTTSDPRIKTFLDLHWLLISHPGLSKTSRAAALASLKRVKKQLKLDIDVSFKPLSKKAQQLLVGGG